jgi:hypothetical protein
MIVETKCLFFIVLEAGKPNKAPIDTVSGEEIFLCAQKSIFFMSSSGRMGKGTLCNFFKIRMLLLFIATPPL